MSRVSKILSGTTRNLKRLGVNIEDVLNQEYYDEMSNAVDHIISESNPDIEIVITLKEDQEDYPLTTDVVTNPELATYDNNIVSIKITKMPDTFSNPFTILSNKEFIELIDGQASWTGILSLFGERFNVNSLIKTGIELSGVKNGINTEFALPDIPVQYSEEVFLNGVRLTRDVDYTALNRGITIISEIIPNTITFGHYQDDQLVCNYIKSSILGANLVSTRQPLIGTIINKRLKVYPIPDSQYDGVEIKAMVYLKSSTSSVSATAEPNVDKEYDKAIENFTTAQFLAGKDRAYYMSEFEKEVKRLRPTAQRKQHNLSRPPISGFL